MRILSPPFVPYPNLIFLTLVMALPLPPQSPVCVRSCSMMTFLAWVLKSQNLQAKRWTLMRCLLVMWMPSLILEEKMSPHSGQRMLAVRRPCVPRSCLMSMWYLCRGSLLVLKNTEESKHFCQGFESSEELLILLPVSLKKLKIATHRSGS